MDTQQLRAQRMKFFFISNRNTYATNPWDISLRNAAILFVIVNLACQAWFLNEFIQMSFAVANDMTLDIVYQLAQVLLWLLMLTGPISQNFNLCYRNLRILEIATCVEFPLKLFIFEEYARHVLPLEITIIYLFVFIVYFTFWFGAVYIYYSYTKSLGLGLLTNEAGGQTILQASSTSQAINANLSVDQVPTIVLTNPRDVAFVRDAQLSILNQTTLPSGIVVPSGGNGKNWRATGNTIVLV
jgi:hypothetical protein